MTINKALRGDSMNAGTYYRQSIVTGTLSKQLYNSSFHVELRSKGLSLSAARIAGVAPRASRSLLSVEQNVKAIKSHQLGGLAMFMIPLLLLLIISAIFNRAPQRKSDVAYYPL